LCIDVGLAAVCAAGVGFFPGAACAAKAATPVRPAKTAMSATPSRIRKTDLFFIFFLLNPLL
jgi:hypothetical protein